jgi:hypothetical protein
VGEDWLAARYGELLRPATEPGHSFSVQLDLDVLAAAPADEVERIIECAQPGARHASPVTAWIPVTRPSPRGCTRACRRARRRRARRGTRDVTPCDAAQRDVRDVSPSVRSPPRVRVYAAPLLGAAPRSLASCMRRDIEGAPLWVCFDALLAHNEPPAPRPLYSVHARPDEPMFVVPSVDRVVVVYALNFADRTELALAGIFVQVRSVRLPVLCCLLSFVPDLCAPPPPPP